MVIYLNFEQYFSLQDENSNYRPVCSYVTPLRAGRLLDTPRQAMRFVSLLRYEKQQTIGGGNKLEQWSSLLTFLAKNKGVSEKYHLNNSMHILFSFTV